MSMLEKYRKRVGEKFVVKVLKMEEPFSLSSAQINSLDEIYSAISEQSANDQLILRERMPLILDATAERYKNEIKGLERVL